MESELLLSWKDERAELAAEISRLQDELAGSRAVNEELRFRGQALTDRLAQSVEPSSSMSIRLDTERREWRKKLVESRERESRQTLLVHKLQSKVLEYRGRCQQLEQQLLTGERELRKRERIRDEHSNSMESALIRLEEEQNSIGLAELNSFLRSQLSKSEEANEALREDLSKLTADWSRAVEEAGLKEKEWQNEREILTGHISQEHTRLLTVWGGVVKLKRQCHTVKSATD
uniref:Rootletin-like coiled-coil domain-containing protein n=1 Tax=Paramormyrops kingsleyae TaxID=1676925 RepID=A0A3B3RKT8_9TELE